MLIEEIYEKYFGKTSKSNLVKTIQKLAKISQNDSQISQNDSQISQNDEDVNCTYQCKFCNKKFKHASSKCKHEKDRCKTKISQKKSNNGIKFKMNLDHIKKQIQEEKIEYGEKLSEKLKEQFIEQLDKVLKRKDKQMFQLIKHLGTKIHDNSKNLYLSVKLNSFDKTDYSHITDKDYLECIRKGNLGIPYLIEKLHFNPEKPENHNVYINNIKSDYIKLYKNSKWVYALQYETINMMVQDNANIIEDKIEQWFDTNHKYAGKKYKEILDKYPRFLIRLTDSKYVGKKVEQEAKLLMFNKKDIVLKQYNKMKQLAGNNMNKSIMYENKNINNEIKDEIIKELDNF